MIVTSLFESASEPQNQAPNIAPSSPTDAHIPVHSDVGNDGAFMLSCNDELLESSDNEVCSDPDHIASNTACLRVAGVIVCDDGVAHMRQCRYATCAGQAQDVAIEELILAVKCGCIPYKYHCLSLKLSAPKIDVMNELRTFKRQLHHDVNQQLVAYKRAMYEFKTMSLNHKK